MNMITLVFIGGTPMQVKTDNVGFIKIKSGEEIVATEKSAKDLMATGLFKIKEEPKEQKEVFIESTEPEAIPETPVPEETLEKPETVENNSKKRKKNKRR